MPSRQAIPAAKAPQAEGLLAEENVKHYISTTPLGRLGEPKDIAAVAVFLASDSSSWSPEKPSGRAEALARISDEAFKQLDRGRSRSQTQPEPTK